MNEEKPHTEHALYQTMLRAGQTPDPSHLTEEQRVMLSADEVMTLYLIHVGKHTNVDFIRVVLQYILLYRDCLNQYGWQKVAEADLRETK